jgi:hypothetical protein
MTRLPEAIRGFGPALEKIFMSYNPFERTLSEIVETLAEMNATSLQTL